ncbi:MAG TPA: hypothetical protein DCP92_01380, partial [Nitrospiraceae bacterium]|nr:hypothetical protein [Nitrospiraceae bacterium]
DLDVEWSGAVAKNASILFVASKSTHSTDGVDLSAQYIVDNNLAAVMSTSFGSCEADMGTSENAFYNNLWQQAAAEGITPFVASGDSGAAGCNLGSDRNEIKSKRATETPLKATANKAAIGGVAQSERLRFIMAFTVSCIGVFGRYHHHFHNHLTNILSGR